MRFFCRDCNTTFDDRESLHKHKQLYACPAPSLALAEGDEMTMVEIPKSVYDSLLAHKETVEALEAINDFCAKRSPYWIEIITDGNPDEVLLSIRNSEPEIRTHGCNTLPAAIRALHEQVKPKGDL